MGRSKNELEPVKGVNNPVQRRIYNDTKLFDNIADDNGKLQPNSILTEIDDTQLDSESIITTEDIELAFAELQDNPFLQGLFNARVE